jgi:hypothetical protein
VTYLYYLEYCLERNEELDEDCKYQYYVLHDAQARKPGHWFDDDYVYDNGRYVVLKVYGL